MKLSLLVVVLLCVAQSQARDYRTQHDVATREQSYPYPYPPKPPYGWKNDGSDVVAAEKEPKHSFPLRLFGYFNDMLSVLHIKLQQLHIIFQLFEWSNLARYLSYLIKLLGLFVRDKRPMLQHMPPQPRERYPPECMSKDPRPECHGYPR